MLLMEFVSDMMLLIVQLYSFTMQVANEFMAPPNLSIKSSSPLWTGTQV